MASDRTAIVTGGSSGIGLACAKELARRGYNVALVARDAGRLEAAAEAVRAEASTPNQRIAWKSADLSSWEATGAAFAELAADGFSPEILVNSAGVIIPGEFISMPLESFEMNIEHGFWSVVYPCRAAAPGMVERGHGHIVNVSSVAGYLGIYGYTGYSSAKFAVMGFTEALRFEMKPAGVTVSVVCPPDTDTPALTHEHTLRPYETDVIAGGIKPISPEKVAHAVMRAIDRGHYHVIPDALSAFYFRLKGLLPEVFFAIVDGDVRKARKGK
ncbi:MAG: SDR family oxidoreductase [Coriobacteriia bacterium]|nr:SDR family oxidoreductase [Coriobacteriia bacterium]